MTDKKTNNCIIYKKQVKKSCDGSILNSQELSVTGISMITVKKIFKEYWENENA